MASITAAQAAEFSIEAIPEHYCLDCQPTDQLFEVLPFKPIEGHELWVNAADASSSGLSNYADAEAAGGVIDTSMPSIGQTAYPLKRIVGEMPVDSIITDVYGSHRDILRALIKLKVEAVRDHFKLLLIRGDSTTNPEEFDGLRYLADPALEVPAAGGAPDGGTVAAGEIEELLSGLNPRMGAGNVYLVMHAKAYKHLLKNNYGEVEHVLHPKLGALPSIVGVPILIDNFIPVDETRGISNDCTSIYGVILGDGLGVCGIYPAVNAGKPIQVRGPVVKEATDTMWYHVSMDVGLGCFNTGALARLLGVKHAN